MKQLHNVLMHRLRDKGLTPAEITLFIRDAGCTFVDDSSTELREMNRRLHALGWDTIDLDDHTFQLMIAQFESEKDTGD